MHYISTNVNTKAVAKIIFSVQTYTSLCFIMCDKCACTLLHMACKQYSTLCVTFLISNETSTHA